MNDGVSSVDAGEASRSQLLSAGAMLRSAREAAGLHVAALAVSMKVPVKKLEALEMDRLDLLPDVVFVRALASSVCRALKIDPVPILDKLPRSSVQPLISGDGVNNTPFRSHGASMGWSIPAAIKTPSVLLVLVLLMGAGAVFFFPVFQAPEPVESDVVAKPIASPEPPSLPAVQAQDAPVPLTAPMEVPDAPAVILAPQPVIVAPISEPAAIGPAPMQTADRAIIVPKPLADKAPEPVVLSNAASNFLTLKAKASSWVQVVDSKGAVQLSKTLMAGESVSVGGVTPLSVVIGRADALDVDVRGKPFSLTDITKENVARFEVK